MSAKKLSNDKKQKVRNNKNMKLKKNKDSDSEDEIETNDSDYETMSEDDTSDSSYKPPKHKSKSKRVVEEDSDDDTDSDDDDDEEESMSPAEITKFISRVFPSKYMQEKVENNKRAKSNKNNKKKTKNSRKDKVKRNKKNRDDDEDEDDDDEDEDEDEDDEDEDEDDEEDEDEEEDEDSKFNILFTLGGDDDDEEREDDFIEEDEDLECDSEDEQMFMKEKYERVVNHEDDKQTCEKNKNNNKKNKNKKSNKHSATTDEHELTDVEQEYMELVETKKQLIEQLNKKPKNKILSNAIRECNDSIKKLVKKSRTKNAKLYHKLIHDDKKRTNEIDYFKTKLSNKEQLRVMKDLKEINSHINVEKPYRLALLDSKMPSKFKAIALQKLNVLRSMDPGDPEYYKIKNWVDTFMRVPFGLYKSLTVKMEDGIDICHSFMENAKKTLDDCVYGLDDAKLQIMQMLGQWISNPGALGTAIAIKGPPGTGKTSLVKDGISKILGREFTFIALGGAGDSSFLEGHSYTYEGSSWGKIVQIIIDSKCMNPVIYFDELDKISDTPRGEEIIGVLTHLTDTSQNNQFHDKYFSEVDFDLSKCLFIFSYNDESKVNAILRDRMYRIQTKGYDAKEKVIIARNYLLPKIREQVNFTEEDIIITDEVINYIVSNDSLTKEEAGVRNLKRCLEIIYTKLNLFRLVKTGTNIFGKDVDFTVTFPFTVTKKTVDIFIKNDDSHNQSMLAMYV